MSDTNYSSTTNLEIVLMGIPGLHGTQQWLSIPVFIMFLVAFFGNLTILLTIVTDQSLHEPMHYFISMLSAVDLIVTIALLPNCLNVLWFGSQTLSYNACLVQLFFTSCFCAVESTILILMAYDRYVAVCNPLRYRTIIQKSALKVSLIVGVRGLSGTLPVLLLVPILLNCKETIVLSLFCDYFAFARGMCSHIFVIDNYVYVPILLLLLLDITIIIFSYFMVARAALKLGLRESRQKIFYTCSSHIFVIASFYFCAAVSTITLFFDKKIPEHIRTLFSIIYFTVPPTLNPLIYGIKTKEIRKCILEYVRKYSMHLSRECAKLVH
ncbi:putative olfactory receptor 52L2 [Protopterus annectens]|uniref:putative olfactory receptor 52L2 n=1 Tax=Protopterus annectens TaxID=7888 RepID=UPI001CFBA540|nr:putative olfactory receptor 52L2 [Protopterus annectens]